MVSLSHEIIKKVLDFLIRINYTFLRGIFIISYINYWGLKMKKLLFIFALLFAIPAFAKYPVYHPMD